MDGVVAQLVERLVRNEKVRGSNPLGSTSLNPKGLSCFSRGFTSPVPADTLLRHRFHPFPFDLFPAVGAADEGVAGNEVQLQMDAAAHREVGAGGFTFFPTVPKDSMVSIPGHTTILFPFLIASEGSYLIVGQRVPSSAFRTAG